MTGGIAYVVDCGDGACIEREQLSMTRFFVLSLLLPLLMGGSAFARPELPSRSDSTSPKANEPLLSIWQEDLEANRNLQGSDLHLAPGTTTKRGDWCGTIFSKTS